jgi:cytochrome c oxidase assembly protein subunit 11
MHARHANRKLVSKLVMVSVGMFIFGVFAMPPLYDKFCEITGIGQAGIRIEDASENQQIASDRTVRIVFDATANSAVPWDFEPIERSMIVNLGEPSESAYSVTSLIEEASTGRAVYNVTPPEAAQYFVKTECFCFSRQELAGLEHREMPVRFYIETDLPEEIEEITLSYTFFLNEETGLAQQSGKQRGL